MALPKFVVSDEVPNTEPVIDEELNGISHPDPGIKPTGRPIKGSVRDTSMKQDPKPAPTKRMPGRPSKSDLEREVAAELQALLMMGSMMWSNIDAECAPVLSKQSKDIADSLAAILAKNPKLLERMRDMTGLGDYLKLFAAVLPVVKVVQAHHIQPVIAKRSEVIDGN